MKVETPQLLWNQAQDDDKGRNAPLYSIDLLSTSNTQSNILATAGNTPMIHLWNVAFGTNATHSSTSKDKEQDSSTGMIFQKSSSNNNNTNNNIEYKCSLTRHESSVNGVRFSPDGLHLATASDAGTIIIWSIPPHKRGGGHGKHYWSAVTHESELSVKIVSTHCDGICDLSWSRDSKRFTVGTIDQAVLVYEDKHYSSNHNITTSTSDVLQHESDWAVVYRNTLDHSGGFVQGVAYDPLNVYVASLGSDRTLRIASRKPSPKLLKKQQQVLKASDTNSNSNVVEELLTSSKLEWTTKSKQIKHYTSPPKTIESSTESSSQTTEQEGETTTTTPKEKQTKHKLFCDEATCESFFRRLDWTTDGAFLMAPAAVWKDATQDTSSFATLLFARHEWDEPYRVWSGLDKPSVAVRPNPVLFALPSESTTTTSSAQQEEERKENTSPTSTALPYRSIVAVLTLDTVLIYDTHHTQPLAVIQGLHYANLTDAAWSACGHNLMVSSTDGYLSIVTFAPGELGTVYQTAPTTSSTTVKPLEIAPTEVHLPPCEDDEQGTNEVVLEAPPRKKAKVTVEEEPQEEVVVEQAVTQLSLTTPQDEQEQPPQKKKKRIQPMLLTSTTAN